jgi:hypothetical protein
MTARTMRDALAELFPNLKTDEAAAILAATSTLTEAVSVLETMPKSLDESCTHLALMRAQEALFYVRKAAKIAGVRHV